MSCWLWHHNRWCLYAIRITQLSTKWNTGEEVCETKVPVLTGYKFLPWTPAHTYINYQFDSVAFLLKVWGATMLNSCARFLTRNTLSYSQYSPEFVARIRNLPSLILSLCPNHMQYDCTRDSVGCQKNLVWGKKSSTWVSFGMLKSVQACQNHAVLKWKHANLVRRTLWWLVVVKLKRSLETAENDPLPTCFEVMSASDGSKCVSEGDEANPPSLNCL